MSNVLSDLDTEIIQVERQASEGSWTEGKYNPPEVEILEMEASVQPMKMSEILRMPEGDRSREWLVCFTKERLFMTQEDDAKGSDIVIRDGKRFRVKGVNNWQIGTDLPHYEAYLCKIDGEGGPDEQG